MENPPECFNGIKSLKRDNANQHWPDKISILDLSGDAFSNSFFTYHETTIKKIKSIVSATQTPPNWKKTKIVLTTAKIMPILFLDSVIILTCSFKKCPYVVQKGEAVQSGIPYLCTTTPSHYPIYYKYTLPRWLRCYFHFFGPPKEKLGGCQADDDAVDDFTIHYETFIPTAKVKRQ